MVFGRILRGRSRRSRRVRGGRRAETVRPVHLRRPDPSCRRAPPVSAAPRPAPRRAQPGTPSREGSRHLEELYRGNYVKEVFGDSDTVAVISGVPTASGGQEPAPPDQMVATRTCVNRPGRLAAGVCARAVRPTSGPRELEEMERQVKELKIDAWKMYTGALETGEKALAHGRREGRLPVLEAPAQASGSRTSASHKGLPLRAFNEEACQPLDLEKAAQDWPGPELHRLPLRLPRHRRGSLAGARDEFRDVAHACPGSRSSATAKRKHPEVTQRLHGARRDLRMTVITCPLLCGTCSG